MNLRAALDMMSKPKPKADPVPERVFTDCWTRQVLRPLEQFPGAADIRRETIMLMQTEALPEAFDPKCILYLDTETTGLAGGAGTVAFEVGLGRMTYGGFAITQLVMRDYPEERFLLDKVKEALNDVDVICTFNGRTFDVPLLRDRFLMNRMSPACLDKPHIDLLHIARRVFKLRLQRCRLTNLEEAVLGIPRSHDLPGSEVPQRYFDYLKTGEFSLLNDVLSHNEQDIASLCVLLSRMCAAYEQPETLLHGEDLYSMGVGLDRQRHTEEARRCWRLVTGGRMRAASQQQLARSYRRAGDRETARDVWLEMITRHEGGVQPYIELAKHYEHVERDPRTALEYTRRAMMLLAEPSLLTNQAVQETQNALQYRYARLRKKAAQAQKEG
ncbi:MAG: ribonuclease H-like domain-containing protein [Clostridia bacterium]|nr:ribonuclease H-like domain-containing protein [Clostridia bacterium]